MKQSHAKICVIISLILSLISFILSLIAFYLPNWKSVQLRPSSLSIISSKDTPMDPLIRSEIEKYTNILYRPGDLHSFGLLTHCISGGDCGRNNILSFHETNFQICHEIKYHHQCIFSNTLSSSNSNKCTCQKPTYIQTIYILLILTIILEFLFFLANLLRLLRSYCTYLNDIQLRLMTIISTLFSSIFLLIILIQHYSNRLTESLEFFVSMHRYYYSQQIYSFSTNLESIIKHIEQHLDVDLGACFVCIILILILTIVSFFTSSTIEIKTLSTIEEDEKNYSEQNHQLIISRPILRPPPPPPTRKRMERFVPSESMQLTPQTEV